MGSEETPKPHDPKPPEAPGFMSRIGRKWKRGLAALSMLTASEMAMEGVAEAGEKTPAAATEKKKEEKPDRALEARKIWANEMTIEENKEFPGEDGKIVYYFEGEGVPTPDGRKRHEIGMTIIDEGDPKVQGDERRYDVLIETQDGNAEYKEEITFKDKTPIEAKKSGKQLQNPFGEAKMIEKDGRMVPETDADATRARINKYYWAIVGMKRAGQLDSPQGKEVVKEFKEWLNQAMSQHEIEIDREAAKKAYDELFAKE